MKKEPWREEDLVFVEKLKPCGEFLTEEARDSYLAAQNSYLTWYKAYEKYGFDMAYGYVSDLREFERTKSPVAAVQLMTRAHIMGVYPPKAIMDWLYGGFLKFQQNSFSGDLDKLLGLKGDVSGKDLIGGDLAIRRNSYLHEVMEILIKRFGLKKITAALLVICREESLSAGGEKLPEPESLVRTYNTYPGGNTDYPWNKQIGKEFVDSFRIAECDNEYNRAFKSLETGFIKFFQSETDN